jgi:hypothetical protein
LFIAFLALVVYWAAGMFFHEVKWLNASASGRLKDILALFILFVQISYSSRFIQRSTTVLSFFAIVGYLFAIQHWPYGRVLFIGSFAIIISLLFWDSVRSRTNRGINLCILAFPAIHLLVITGYIYRINFGFILDLIAMSFVAIVVGRSIFKT